MIHRHAGRLQTEAAAAARGSLGGLSGCQRRFGSQADEGPAPKWTPEEEPREWAM